MTHEEILQLTLAFAALAFAGFLVAAALALQAASHHRMSELERRGIEAAQNVLRLASTPLKIADTVFVGSSLAIIVATAIATDLALTKFGRMGLVYAIASTAVAVLFIVHSVPRLIALVSPDRVALAVALPFSIAAAVLAPLASGLDRALAQIASLLGADPGRLAARSVDDELRGAIDLHQRSGTGEQSALNMLGGVLDLKELELFDVMVHRTKMRSIDAATPPGQILEEVLRSGHSRFPVWRDRPDNIVGVLHAKDLFQALQLANGDVTRIDIDEICTPPWFVPDTTTVADQLTAFLRRKSHFALVVDEYGEVMGLVTLEDILEEIVGEIRDEHDVGAVGVRREPSGSYLVDGAVPIRDLNRMHGWHLPDDEATTIAGLVIHEAQMIPEAGQAFTFYGFRFEVLRKRRNQLVSIRLTPVVERAT